jgi:ABC-type dipeptide/oligopeptide/nickel transport system permease subunit
MLAISSLSFLGLGIQPPHPEWGAMLNDGRTYLESAPQLVFYPAAILLTALACNLLSDALRGALDPTIKTNG